MAKFRYFSVYFILSLVLLSGLPLLAQIDSQAYRLIQLKLNTGKLEVTLQLDRDEYLAGEDGELTIVVVNPTTDPLEVLAPFKIETGGIDLQVNDPSKKEEFGTEWWYSSPHPFAHRDISETAPSIILQPGERLERRFRLSDPHFGLEAPILRGMPRKPGRYRLTYSYIGAHPVEFRVVAPKLDTWTRVKLQQTTEYREKGETTKLERFVAIAALETQGEHFVVVSRCCAPIDLTTDSAGRLTESASWAIAPYVRVAKSPKPITFVGAVADNAERITLVWTNKDGESTSLRLDQERHVIGKPRRLPIILGTEVQPKVVLGRNEEPMLEYTSSMGQRVINIP